MKTIPDMISDMKEWWRKIIDTVYKVSSNIKALALILGPGRKDGVTGNRERGTAMLIKKLIVRLRMWYADDEDTMASVGITNQAIGTWVVILEKSFILSRIWFVLCD